MEKINYKTIIGIDVSKDSLDVCCLNYSTASEQYLELKNALGAIKKWLKSLKAGEVLCVVEYTGNYSCWLLDQLSVHGVAVAAVNPHRSSSFINALGLINKNDKLSAKALALMGRSLELPLYVMRKEAIQKRKQILQSLNALKKQRQMLRNQLHALSYQVIVQEKVKQAFEQTLNTVNEQIGVLEEEFNDLSDEDHQQAIRKITSVIGVGEKTARALINATGGLENFQHHRQLAKFIGIVPSSHDSGTSVRYRGPITRKGNSELRACLYMAARSAKRYNLACKALYEGLRSRGKGHKQAMVAVMNKLIRQVLAVVKNGSAFDNNHYLKYVK